tara:strand:- start:1078 stop:2148 length:1071 start_codon:yes stop_codon:yes gene_type:complete
MPAEKQFKFGITCEFKPLWDEFESLAPGSKKSKMIRFLIYKFLYKNGRRTNNSFENATANDWEYVEGALKVHNKFTKNKIDLMEPYKIDNRIFWVEEYNYKVKDKLKTKEEIDSLKENGYHEVPRIPNSNVNPSDWNEPIDQDLDKIVLQRMFTKREEEGHVRINGQKDHDLFYERINKVRPHRIEAYISKPNKYYIKCKVKIQAFDYYEKAYKKFKRDIRYYKRIGKTEGEFQRPSIEDLFNLNQTLKDELIQNHLMNFELSNNFGKINLDFVRQEGFKMNWQDIPKRIDDCLLLNSFYLESKKNLNRIKRDALRIYKHYTILEFIENESPKIRGPRDFVIQDADYEKASEIYED